MKLNSRATIVMLGARTSMPANRKNDVCVTGDTINTNDGRCSAAIAASDCAQNSRVNERVSSHLAQAYATRMLQATINALRQYKTKQSHILVIKERLTTSNHVAANKL